MKRHENKLAITLFFFTFLVFLFMKKVFLAQHHIEFSGFATLIVSSLILGKVVLLLDKLAVTRKYDHLRNSTRILFRSLIYLLGYVIFMFAEHSVKALFAGKELLEALSHQVHFFLSMEGIATLTLLSITFLFFNAFWILTAHMGPEKLRDFYFGKKEN